MRKNISERYGDAIARLRGIREDMGLSQERFSDALGISLSAYGKIENYERALSQDNLKRLHDRFGISADYLLFGEPTSLEAAWLGVVNCTDIDKMIVLSRLILYFAGDETRARRGEDALSGDFAKFVSDIMIKYDNRDTS